MVVSVVSEFSFETTVSGHMTSTTDSLLGHETLSEFLSGSGGSEEDSTNA